MAATLVAFFYSEYPRDTPPRSRSRDRRLRRILRWFLTSPAAYRRKLQEATAANDKPLGLRVVNVEPMVYSSAEKAVLELTQAGTPFEQVEQVIQQLPLDEEFKSMLWLFAWAEQPRAHRQAILHSVADQARARDRETASV